MARRAEETYRLSKGLKPEQGKKQMASVDRVGVGTERHTAWPWDITQKPGLTHPVCSASLRINKPIMAAAHMGSQRREGTQRE